MTRAIAPLTRSSVGLKIAALLRHAPEPLHKVGRAVLHAAAAHATGRLTDPGKEIIHAQLKDDMARLHAPTGSTCAQGALAADPAQPDTPEPALTRSPPRRHFDTPGNKCRDSVTFGRFRAPLRPTTNT